MESPFKFLSISEFERLYPEEKRAYLSEATAELERTKVDQRAGGWHTLFRQDQPREQQGSQPKDDTKPTD